MLSGPGDLLLLNVDTTAAISSGVIGSQNMLLLLITIFYKIIFICFNIGCQFFTNWAEVIIQMITNIFRRCYTNIVYK